MVNRRRVEYLPTPFEITVACASIRSTWTPSERRRRWVGPQSGEEALLQWSPPVVNANLFRRSRDNRTSDLAS